MSVGTGAATLQNLPSQAYVTDAALFFQLTSRQVKTFNPVPAPGAGQFVPVVLPQVGVISKLLITFVGSIVVAGGAATTSNRWPYGLLDHFLLRANGQNELWSCDGLDLAVLRDIRYPAFAEFVDTFPGTVGGGDSIANGTYALSLTWEVPLAMDDVSLIGSLYGQSPSTNLLLQLNQAMNAAILSAIPGTAAITGTFYCAETMYEVPFNDKGELVVPDLSRLHGFNAIDVPFLNVGPVRSPLVRSQGQLVRLFSSASSAANARLSALPNAAASKKIDQWQFIYGLNQTPYDFLPASALLSLNNQWYGRPAPYDRLVLDLVKENPTRDVILMAGITEPAAVTTVDPGVTVTAGNVHLVQETLF